MTPSEHAARAEAAPDLLDLHADLGSVRLELRWARKECVYGHSADDEQAALVNAIAHMRDARDRLNATIAAAEKMQEVRWC